MCIRLVHCPMFLFGVATAKPSELLLLFAPVLSLFLGETCPFSYYQVNGDLFCHSAAQGLWLIFWKPPTRAVVACRSGKTGHARSFLGPRSRQQKRVIGVEDPTHRGSRLLFVFSFFLGGGGDSSDWWRIRNWCMRLLELGRPPSLGFQARTG